MENVKLRRAVLNASKTVKACAEALKLPPELVTAWIDREAKPDEEQEALMLKHLKLKPKDRTIFDDPEAEKASEKVEEKPEEKAPEKKVKKKKGPTGGLELLAEFRCNTTLTPEQASNGEITVKSRGTRLRKAKVSLQGIVMCLDADYIVHTGISEESFKGRSAMVLGMPHYDYEYGVKVNPAPVFIDGELCLTLYCTSNEHHRVNYGYEIGRIVFL